MFVELVARAEDSFSTSCSFCRSFRWASANREIGTGVGDIIQEITAAIERIVEKHCCFDDLWWLLMRNSLESSPHVGDIPHNHTLVA